MLSKDKRLNLRTNFSWIVAGKKTETTHFKVFIRNGTNAQALVGVAMKSSVFKKAHDRSQAKRIAFQVLSAIYSQLPNSQNLVIMPKVDLSQVSVETLIKEVDDIRGLYQSN